MWEQWQVWFLKNYGKTTKLSAFIRSIEPCVRILFEGLKEKMTKWSFRYTGQKNVNSKWSLFSRSSFRANSSMRDVTIKKLLRKKVGDESSDGIILSVSMKLWSVKPVAFISCSLLRWYIAYGACLKLASRLLYNVWFWKWSSVDVHCPLRQLCVIDIRIYSFYNSFSGNWGDLKILNFLKFVIIIIW